MQQTNNWIKNPTKKQMTMTLLIGLIGFVLLLLSMTNFFTETPFQGKYLMLYILQIGAGLTIWKVCRSYYVQNK
jgi:divalent metal cation (Fe/Co/Zn/Cd) transporter